MTTEAIRASLAENFDQKIAEAGLMPGIAQMLRYAYEGGPDDDVKSVCTKVKYFAERIDEFEQNEDWDDDYWRTTVLSFVNNLSGDIDQGLFQDLGIGFCMEPWFPGALGDYVINAWLVAKANRMDGVITVYSDSRVRSITLNVDGEIKKTYCIDCGRWVNGQPCDMAQPGSASRRFPVCEDCECNYHYCEVCGNYVNDDDYNYSEDACYECAENRRHEDNDRSSNDIVDRGYKTFFCHMCGDDAYAETYGIELEEGCCDNGGSYNDAVDEAYSLGECMRTPESKKPIHFWHFKSDGSLYGDYTVEAVSQPFTMAWFSAHEELFRRLVRAFDWNGFCSGYEANAGLHIHVSDKFFTDEMKYIVARFINEHYTFLLRVSRRDQDCLDEWARTVDVSFDDYGDWRRVLERYIDKCSYCRYMAMNFSSQNIHNTIEFRFFEGTNDFSLLKASIEIIHAIVHLAKVWKKVTAPMKPKHLLRYMQKHGYSETAVKQVSSAARDYH